MIHSYPNDTLIFEGYIAKYSPLIVKSENEGILEWNHRMNVPDAAQWRSIRTGRPARENSGISALCATGSLWRVQKGVKPTIAPCVLCVGIRCTSIEPTSTSGVSDAPIIQRAEAMPGRRFKKELYRIPGRNDERHLSVRVCGKKIPFRLSPGAVSRINPR